MAKQLIYQVLSASDFDEVFGFAERNLQSEIPDETERTFHSWTVKWRRESLEHYLRLGWSFIVREKEEEAELGDKGRIVGFFLAQPLLFFRGHTQTLWVEHIEAIDSGAREGLIEVAVRVAREKNLQRVLFSDADPMSADLQKWSPVPLKDAIAEVRTTKGS